MNYIITRYTRTKAKQYGVLVKLSSVKGKKIDVIKNKIVIASVGALGYSDYPTYIKSHGLEYANIRRKLYRIRHKNDRNVVNTHGYWADRLLW
jgi:hypothetical protein